MQPRLLAIFIEASEKYSAEDRAQIIGNYITKSTPDNKAILVLSYLDVIARSPR